MKKIIWDELRFFLEVLESLSVSHSIGLGDGFAVSVGTYAENWVYYPEKVDAIDPIVDATMWFDELDETFMWPLYDGDGELLEHEGLIHAGDITAMSLEPEGAITSRANAGVVCERISSREGAREWALTGWRAFGGDDDVSAEYCVFAEALGTETEKVSLYTARLDGEAAGIFLVTHAPEVMGVYYFGTLPEFRRKGVASAMMKEICKLSSGKKVVLQSTPMGVNFYKSFGFDELFKIPVYSTDSEIL